MFNYNEKLFKEIIKFKGRKRDEILFSAIAQCKWELGCIIQNFENEFKE